MPLLRRQPFTKQKPPADLRPDEEVFFSPLTNEIFRDYEEFFNRILLCNSLVWSCSVTGRPGLTYQEAVESEARARRQLESMPEYLVRPVLYLATLTHRSRLNDMDDDVFGYAKDRYFTGERVEVISKGERRMCTVKQVLPPNGQALSAPAADDVIVITDSESETDSKSSESKREADKIQAFGPDHGRYLYEVQDIHGGSIYMVKGVNVNRKKGLFTREKSKLFLKHYCDSQNSGIWKVKARYMKKFKLSEARLEDFFMGPSPNFEVSEAKRRPGRTSGEGSKEDSLLKKHLKELKEKKKKDKLAAKEQKKEKKYKKKKEVQKDKEKQHRADIQRKMEDQPTLIPFVKSVITDMLDAIDRPEMLKATTVSEQPSQSSQDSAQSGSTVKEESPETVRAKTHLTPEERAELKAKLKAERLAQKQAKKEEMKKKMEEERQKKKEERDRLQEEKRQRDAYLREWNKPREDMECEDLKHLPRPTPVETLISPELFGDTVMLLDFLFIYGGLFEVDKAIPEGVTFESLCKALLERDTNGQYADLVMFLLTALFELQEEEAEEGSELQKETVNVKIPEATEDDVNASDKSYKGRIIAATIASQLPQQNFGSKLSKLQMDSFTVTEILRLHLLGSGAKMSEHSAKFCYQQRGGYSSADDPGLEFMMQEPDLVQALSRSNVYDLPPRDKLKILSTLTGQLLTFVGCRDFIDDQFDRIRQLRSELRQLQGIEQRRERDEATFWYRKRLEERNKEKELEAQRKDQKKKVREERLRIEEMRKDLKEKAKQEGKKLEEYLQANGITIPELPEMPVEENKPITETEEKKEEPKEGERKSARQKALQEKEITMEDFTAENVEWDRVSPEEKAKIKEFYETKERLLMEGVYSAQSGASNSPLGLDRTYRRYWMFSSLPGLFVEDDDEFISNDILQPVEQEAKDQFNSENLPLRMENGEKGMEEKSTSSDKENESFDGSGAKGGVISGDRPLTSNGSNMSQETATPDAPAAADNQETPMDMEEKTDIKPENRLVSVTEQIQERGKVRWAYYSSPEILEELVSNLNPRGNREGQLRNALVERKKQLSSSITKCPCSILTISQEENKKVNQSMVFHQSIKSRNRTTQGAVGNDSAKEFLELNLREMLLDIEERIYIGSLGATKVKDRISWKNCIEQGGYEPQDPEMKWRNGESQSSNSSQGTDSMDVDEPEANRGVSVVKDLARALIQIERGLDRKYLNSPLGTSTDTKKTKKSGQEGGKKKKEEEADALHNEDDAEERKTPVEHWEDGLLSCRSLPQLFLYLSVLEKSIVWSKSALHARCRICRRKGDADKMLLCDACDRGHHMFCLKPPVKNIPRGDWYCPQCRPKLQKPRTPRKNRKSFCEEPEPESSDSDDKSEDDDDDDDSDVDSSDDEEEASTEEDEEDEDTEVGTEDEWEDQPTKIKLRAPPKRAKQSEATSGGQKSASSSRNSTPKQTAGGSRNTTPKETGGGSSSRSRSTKRVSMDTSLELPKSRSGRGSARNSLEPEPRSSSKNDKSSSKKSRPDSRPSSAKRDADKSDSKANKRKRDSTEPVEGDGSPALKKTATKSRGGEWADQMKLAENLVHELIQHDESWPFLKPVTRKEAPDYFDIIKTPMDLCTIRAKINKFEYNSPVSILEDIQLVFRNCEAYNLQTSEEYKAGQRLVKLFVQRVKDMKLDDLIRKSVQSNGDSSSGRGLRRH